MRRRFTIFAAAVALACGLGASASAAPQQPTAVAHVTYVTNFAGPQLQPRQIAAVCYAQGWRDAELIRCTAVALAESHGYLRATHDNYVNGVLASRDVGLFQINIPASAIGTSVETDLYDPALNTAAAWRLYAARHWQPWVAYTTGWAMFTAWWVWHQTDGIPTGPWISTGRYLQQAQRGVANYLAQSLGLSPVPFVDYYSVPPKPTSPPADGVGPRPAANNGSA